MPARICRILKRTLSQAVSKPAQKPAAAAAAVAAQGFQFPADDQRRQHGGAQRETSLHRQVGEIQDTEAQIGAERDQPEHQADFHRAEDFIKRHSRRSSLPELRPEMHARARRAGAEPASAAVLLNDLARALEHVSRNGDTHGGGRGLVHHRHVVGNLLVGDHRVDIA